MDWYDKAMEDLDTEYEDGYTDFSICLVEKRLLDKEWLEANVNNPEW